MLFQNSNSLFKSNRIFFLWAMANLFFAFQFILRLSVGIMRDEIMLQYSVSAEEFANLAGYYYLGYAGMQIPLGIMLDRINFRYITSISISISAIGMLISLQHHDWNNFLLGRFLVGAGSGIAFLAIAKIIKIFFEEKYHTFLIGFAFTLGLIGAVFGGTPMRMIFESFDLDQVFTILSFICLLFAIVMLIFGNIDTAENTSKVSDILKNIINIATNKNIIIICIGGGLLVGALEGFADLWGYVYFEQIFGFSKASSITIVNSVYIGMCFGGPILSFVAKVLRSDFLAIVICATITILIFGSLFYAQNMDLYISIALMFLLGIVCCYQVLVFAVTSKQVDASNAGLAIAFANSINMTFGHYFHKYLGYHVQKNWDGLTSLKGIALYDKANLVNALSSIPIAAAIASLGFIYLYYKSKKNI